jgi:hypothetical protein
VNERPRRCARGRDGLISDNPDLLVLIAKRNGLR